MDVALQGNPKVQVPQPVVAESPVQPAVEPPTRETPALVVTEAAEMLMEADYEAKKAVVDNLKPSEREIKIRKAAQKAAREKEDEQELREKEATEDRYEADDLERRRNLMV